LLSIFRKETKNKENNDPKNRKIMTLKHAISIPAILAGLWFMTTISPSCAQAVHGESINASTPPISTATATNSATAASADVVNTDFETLAAFPFDVPGNAVTNKADLDKVAKQIPKDVKKLDGKAVRIRGFMMPVKESAGKATEFLITRSQPSCCFGGATGLPEFITVKASGKGVVEDMDDAVTVEGTLHVGLVTDSGFITGIYQMDDGKLIKPGH
jgi:hypothetical protein